VPSLLAPIHAEHNSPETLFSEFRSAATEAVKNVRSFQEKMREPRTKQILEHVKDSKEQNSEGIETWLVSQHEDWLDQPALRSANDIQAGGPKVRLEDQAIGQDQPSISQVVQKFKAEHPEASIQLNEDKRTINVQCHARGYTLVANAYCSYILPHRRCPSLLHGIRPSPRPSRQLPKAPLPWSGI
jgi:hypothetical protein